ncbi:BT2A1 protein, partial [Upupa epops]|nr:BT2A1 protein [Upupa epops]
VTLDPNTTHCKLVLSPDFRRVRCLEEGQNLPDTPERYASECCVLGRERFSEGRHCWEVEVEGGEETKWAVGVAEESRERKNYVYFDPVNGFWGVGRFQGQFKALTT